MPCEYKKTCILYLYDLELHIYVNIILNPSSHFLHLVFLSSMRAELDSYSTCIEICHQISCQTKIKSMWNGNIMSFVIYPPTTFSTDGTNVCDCTVWMVFLNRSILAPKVSKKKNSCNNSSSIFIDVHFGKKKDNFMYAVLLLTVSSDRTTESY